MIFKQRVLKEEIIKLVLLIVCMLIPIVLLFACVIITKDNVGLFFTFILVIYFPIFLLALLLSLTQLEWFLIYTDRIEAKGILGVKNTVYWEDVLFVEKTKIPLTSRGMYKNFFIFHDGRKNNGNMFNSDSCYNKKKYNLRIYTTPELEEYITQTLQMNIKCTQ